MLKELISINYCHDDWLMVTDKIFVCMLFY